MVESPPPSADMRGGIATATIDGLRRSFGVSVLAVERFFADERAAFAPRCLSLCDRLRALDATSFTTICEWPSAIAWARELFESVQAFARQRDLETVGRFDRHVRLGETLLIAAALEGRGDVAFDPPLPVPLPFHIPASPLFVDGEGIAEGEITLAGASAAGLRLADGRCLTEGEGLRRAPSVALPGDRALVLSPAAMVPPWAPMPFAVATLGFQVEYQARHLGLVEETLALCRRFVPAHYAVVSAVMRVLALKPLLPGRTLNASYSEYPGACILSAVGTPHEMASFLIHEAHHSLLSAFEAEAPLVPADQAGEASTIRAYSPWRHDLRPPRGLLHALYVFEAVCDFWLAVLDAPDTEPRIAAYGRDQLVRSIIQRWTGLESFRRAATPTARGAQLVETLAGGIVRHTALAEARGLTADIPSLEVWPDGSIREEALVRDCSTVSLRESLFIHATRYDGSGFAVPWMAARPWLFSGFRRPVAATPGEPKTGPLPMS